MQLEKKTLNGIICCSNNLYKYFNKFCTCKKILKNIK